MLDTLSHSISGLLDQRRPGHGLPGGLYTRQDVFEADLDVFFRKHWIAIGLDCDVPEPGDARVIHIGTSSVILLRDDDGQIHVVRNVCRHGGSPASRRRSGARLEARLLLPPVNLRAHGRAHPRPAHGPGLRQELQQPEDGALPGRSAA